MICTKKIDDKNVYRKVVEVDNFYSLVEKNES